MSNELAADTEKIMIENWFTSPRYKGSFFAALLLFLVVFLVQIFNVNYPEYMLENFSTTKLAVLNQHQYWRLLTSTFLHADYEHLLNNLVLLIPLSYLLTAYFGYFYTYVIGLIVAAIVNMLVVSSSSESMYLVGISGFVYWAAASWSVLLLLVHHEERSRTRFAKIIVLIVILLVPDKFRENISYLNHFISFIFGIITALVFYFFNQTQIKSFEKYIVSPAEDSTHYENEF